MKCLNISAIGLLLLFSVGLLDTFEARQKTSNQHNNVEASIRRLISAVDSERISKHLFYLAKDPLPFRKLNLTLPGHEKNTLYEADDYLAGKLEAWGYRVEREGEDNRKREAGSEGIETQKERIFENLEKRRRREEPDEVSKAGPRASPDPIHRAVVLEGDLSSIHRHIIEDEDKHQRWNEYEVELIVSHQIAY